MMRRLLTVFILLFSPGLLAAGAWPREEGQVFVSFGGNFLLSDGAQLPVHYDPTLYLEYGVSTELTLGLAYHKAAQDRVDAGMIFMRLPFGPNTGADHFAFSLGVGARTDRDTADEALLQGGLHWGRGFDEGWFSVDYTATYGSERRSFQSKADFTWGQDLTSHWTAFFQMQIGEGLGGDFYAKANPAIVYRINERNRLSIGAIKALTGDGGSALKLELWSQF